MTIIKLGAPGALKNYVVKQRGDGLAWSRGPAKPFSAQVNTSNPYDQVDIWNEWVMEDWQAGIGRVEADAGGQLFSTADSRVPQQLILSPLLKQCDQRPATTAIASARFMPESMTGTITVGTGNYQKVAMPFSITTADINGGAIDDEISVYFYGQFPTGIQVRISVYTNNSGNPGTQLATTTFFAEDYHKDFSWMGNYIYLESGGLNVLSGSTQYWLVVEPVTAAQTFTLAYHNSGYATAARAYNGSAWSAASSTYFVYTTNAYSISWGSIFTGGGSPAGSTLFRFNGNTYHTYGALIWKYDSANGEFDYVTNTTVYGSIRSAAVFGPKVYFATSLGQLVSMNTSEAITDEALSATLVRVYNGYLYRANGNNLYYTANGSSWTTVGAVGGSDAEIRGMDGMGNDLFMATDKALFRLAPGNVVEEIMRFGSESSDNGLNMLNYGGNLYIPLNGRLFQYSPSGQLIDVWIGEDDLPVDRIGRIDSLCVMNQWLVALVSSQEATYAKPSVLVFQREGWHTIATLPNEINYVSSYTNLGVFYDRANSRLWVGTSALGAMYLEIPDYTLNPYNLTAYKYQFYGWLETDRFWGGQKLLDKDWESVTIAGDNLGANQSIDVYWRDEGSTDWESLGSITSDGQELRWSDYSTRPNGKWIKLGLRLRSLSSTETPRVRAVVVKFLPMVNDRRRDTMTLTLSSYIEFPDRTKDTRTMATQLSDLESMFYGRVHPCIYQDIYGTQYEVHVVDHGVSNTRYTQNRTTGTPTEIEYTLVLEQLPEGTYSA